MNRRLHFLLRAALAGLSLGNVAPAMPADIYKYYNSWDEAYAACLADGATPKICPQNWSNCWVHWPGSAGYGLMTWTSNEQNKGCGLSAGVTYTYHIFPVNPLPSGMNLIGPTSADIVSDQAKSLASANEKQLGGTMTGNVCSLYGNPVDAATGNKIQREVDFESLPGIPVMDRMFNSQNIANTGYLGYGWTFAYSTRVTPETGGVVVREAGARIVHCTSNPSGVYTCPSDVRFKLEKDGVGYKRTWQTGAIERFNSAGNIMEKFSPTGARTRYDMQPGGMVWAEYGPGGHRMVPVWGLYGLSEIWQPDGRKVYYTYDTVKKNLAKVTYPDGKYRQYLYEDPLSPHALTGIIDEAGKRIGTYAYDASLGRAASTQKPNGSQSYGFSISGQGVTVTDAAGNSESLSFASNLGINNLVARTHNSDGKSHSQSFDTNNNLISETDEEGRTTTYTWDTANRLTQKTEAVGTPQERVTTLTYLDAFLSLPTVIEEPSVLSGARKRTEITYDAQNRPITITVSGFTPIGSSVSRTIGLTYAPAGQVASITDGNGHVTQFAYPNCTTGYGCELLSTLTNALGQVTTFDQYDANGRLLRKTAPNGLVTTYTYDLRGRVLTITETPPTGTARTTTYTHDPAGRLQTATLPGRGVLTYTYDAADQLASVTDSLGNQVAYAYDLKGNRTQDVTKDPNGTVVRQVDLAFNARNYPSQINAAGSVTQLVHDAVGNLTQVTDPNGHTTQHQVDSLDRLVRTVDALGGLTDRGYDGGGHLADVVAPNSAETRFEVDDLGNVVRETSPDRGTITTTHDGNGNILTRTDARGITATFTYDALNRVTSVSFPNSAENVTYTYDTCQVGQLCSVTDPAGTRIWGYDGFGRVMSETWVRGGVSKATTYTYTPGDDLATITYPSGRTVAYTRNAIGNITGITTNGSNVLTGRTYRADGLAKSQTWANGLIETKAYDLQGRMTAWTAGTSLNRTYAYDANGNVVQKDSAQFQYDPLDRITWEPGQGFLYDGNGNRLMDAAGGYGYEAASNRMATGPPGGVILDAAGNTLAYAGQTYAYNNAGKLAGANGNASYTYRHDGLRASKTVAGVATYFHYDLDGRLIAETDAGGNTVREYVWDDEVPVAQIEASGVTYLHTDALGTPRLGTNSAGAVVWAWDSDAFGATQPTGSVVCNLRFPGQYFDAETGLHQNGQRTYHPPSGRYLESDPIGLYGGLNSFGYVEGNPLRYTDATGQAIDTLLDLAFIGYDLKRIWQDNVQGSCGNLSSNLTALGADTIGAVIPGVTGLGMTVRAGERAKGAIHKNSLNYVGETHVYRIKGPDGSTYKIGESARGVRASDGASIRAEQQARRLTRETGDVYTTEIRKTFPDKASARDYETRVIERFRRMYGKDSLPGNLTNR